MLRLESGSCLEGWQCSLQSSAPGRGEAPYANRTWLPWACTWCTQPNKPALLPCSPTHSVPTLTPPKKNEFLGGGGEGGVHIRPNTHTHPPTHTPSPPRSEEMDFEPGMEELLMDEVDDAAMEDEEEGFLTRSRSRWAGVGVGVALLCHSGGWNAMGAGLQCALLGGARGPWRAAAAARLCLGLLVRSLEVVLGAHL